MHHAQVPTRNTREIKSQLIPALAQWLIMTTPLGRLRSGRSFVEGATAVRTFEDFVFVRGGTNKHASHAQVEGLGHLSSSNASLVLEPPKHRQNSPC